MRKFRIIIVSVLVILLCSTLNAQENSDIQIIVPKIDAGKLRWGSYNFPVTIINTGEYLKYVSVVCDVKCQGVQLYPERKVVRNYAVYPGDTIKAEATMMIPGNYGDINYELKFYEVVDTLDQLLESQVFQKQAGAIKVPLAKGIAALVQTPMTLPPLVGRHIDFDNDFSRVLPFLVSDGKSLTQIAELTGCDTTFVSTELQYLISRGYYQREGERLLTSVAAIKADEATEEKKLANTLAEQVAAKLAENFAAYYRPVIDSLVKAGSLTGDSNSFFDGGAILYKPYPLMTTFSIWYDLGSTFILDNAPLYILDGSDFCNAYEPTFMYVAAGSPENNGHELFAFMRNYRSYQIFYSDTIPKIICPEGFMFNPQMGMNVTWEYEQPYYPEGFMVDTAAVRTALNHLRIGIDPILKNALDKLTSLGKKYNQPFLLTGHRYWFWNNVATSVRDILVSKGVITPPRKPQFRFDGLAPK